MPPEDLTSSSPAPAQDDSSFLTSPMPPQDKGAVFADRIMLDQNLQQPSMADRIAVDEEFNRQQRIENERKRIKAVDFYAAALPDKQGKSKQLAGLQSQANPMLDGQLFSDLTLNIGATAHLLKKDSKDISEEEYPYLQRSIAASLNRPPPKSESEYRSMLSEYFVKEKGKDTALNELYGNVVLKAFQDTGMGKNRALVSLPTEYVKQWEDQHKDLLDGDAGYHAQANRVYNQTLKDIESLRGKGAETFSALMDFTQGKADGDRLAQVAEHLSSSTPEERQRVYNYIGLAAEAGHIDRGALEQFAINMGQSFSRGFDFIPQGDMQSYESYWRNLKKDLANGGVEVVDAKDGGMPLTIPVNQALKAMFGEDLYKKPTAEQIATLSDRADKEIQKLKIVRELRNVAKSNVDPIRPVLEDSAMERGAYGLAGSLGIMVPVAISPALGVMAYQAQEYDRIMLENPDIDPAFAEGLALFEGAGNAALDRLQLKAINGKLPVFGGLLNGIKSNGIRRVLTTVGAEVLEQNLQEGAQDLIAPLTETMAAALREDMPDKDFGELMKDYVGTRAETFFAVLPLALIGGGIGTYRDLKNPALQFADARLQEAGFSPAQRDYISAAETPEERDARVKEEWGKRKEADIAAGKSLYESRIEEAKSQKAGDTVEVSTRADGTSEWIVRDPAGKEVARVASEDEAVTIIADRGEAEIKSQANVVADLLDSDWRKDKLPNFEAIFGGEVTPEQLLNDAKARGDTKLVESIKASIEAHGNDPAELAKLRVLGESWVTPYAEGQYKAFVKLNEGHTAQDAFEELAHNIFDIDLAEGRITKDQAREWISQAAAAGVANYKFGTDAEVRESMAQIAQDFARNKIDQTNLPSSFVAFLKKLYTEFVEFMRRAKLLDQAFKDGKIDAEFERYLMGKIGLSDASMIEREVNRIEGEQGGKSFSIGKKYADDQQYHQIIPEVTHIDPKTLLVRDAGEVRQVSDKDAKSMDYSEPVQASLFKNGEVRLFDGHHRRAAAIQSGIPFIPVTLQAINAKGPDINRLIEQSNSRLFQDSRATPEAGADVRTVGDTKIVGPTSFAIRAYHGTPHEVDRFSTEKIGTGEGGQAFGYGLYFAQNQDVAENYKVILGRAHSSLSIDGKKYDGLNRHQLPEIDQLITDAWHSLPKNYRSKNELIRELKNKASSAFKEWKPRFKQAIEKAKSEAIDVSHPGNLYGVTIDAEDHELLDWDKPLSEQSEEVRNALEAIIKDRVPVEISDSYLRDATAKGATIYQLVAGSFGERAGKTDIAQASEAMASRGIKGIRYLDQGSRFSSGGEIIGIWQGDQREMRDTGAGKWYARIKVQDRQIAFIGVNSDGAKTSKGFDSKEEAQAWAEKEVNGGTSNFVIFDGKHIQITEKNGQPVSVEDVPVDGGVSFSIRSRDEAYMAAVESGNEAEQQRLVDEAAKEAGYPLRAYHGTPNGDFQKFEDNGRGFFFTNKELVAKGYTYKRGLWLSESPTGKVINTHLKMENPLEIDAMGSRYNNIRFPGIEWKQTVFGNLPKDAVSVSDAALKAFEMGHDGLIVKNVMDAVDHSDKTRSTVYVVKNASQIKSADPITRDDEGNVIPLSQRFNPESNDIRFSIREVQNKLDEMKSKLPEYSAEVEEINGGYLANIYDAAKKPVGVAAFYYEPDSKRIVVMDSGIEKEFRGKGFGQALYREIAKKAQEIGAETISGAPISADAVRVRSKLFDTKTGSKIDGTSFPGGAFEWAESKVPSEILFSIQSQEQIDRVNKAVADTTQFAEGRMALYERAKERFKAILAENKDILDALKEGGAAPEKIRRQKLIQAIAELEVILRQLPAEVRGKVGGFGVLARGGTGDTFLANFFRDRVRMIDEQLEKYLSKEYDEELSRVFDRAKPKKNLPGEKPKGIGADIQDLFAKVKEAQRWSPEEINAHLAAIDSRLESEDLSPADEARLTREADLIGLVGGWKNKTSNEKAHAIKTLKETWAKGYYNFILKKTQEKEQREADRREAIAATGKEGVLSERQEADKKENGLKGKFKKGYFNLISWDQFVSVLFGEKSEIATRLSDGERKANAQKEDATQAKMDEISDFFAKLAKGDKLKGEQLRWQMSQKSIKPFAGTPWSNLEFSEMEAISATMLWMQEDGKRHMLGKFDDGGRPISNWHYTQEFVDLLENNLSKEAKALRDFLLKKYDSEYDSINKVYKALNGINLPKIENYSPVTVAPITAPAGTGIDPVTGGVMAARGTSPGALRSRGQAIAEPKFNDVLQTYIAHTKQMEHWKAYAPFMAEANGILRNRDVQNAIEAKGGKEAKAVLNTWTDLFSQGGVRSAEAQLGLSKDISALGGRAARVALVGRLGTIIIQSTQLGAALAEMPTGSYILRMSKLLSGNLGWKAAFESDYIQRRLSEMPPIVRQAVEGLQSDRPNVVKSAVDKLGRLISGADALFTAGTYAITYDYHLKQAKGMGIPSPEAYAKSAAERAVDRLAQPTRMGARSVIENTSTGLIRNFWAFASESRKNLGLAAYAMASKDPARIGRTLVSLVILNSLVGNIIRNAWSDARDDDDEEWFDEKHWGLKRMIASTLVDSLQVRGIPVLGDAISTGLYDVFNQYHQGGSLVSFSNATRALNHIPKYMDGDADWEMTFKDIDGILSVGGLFNENIAAAASLSHLATDAFGLTKNTKKATTGD